MLHNSCAYLLDNRKYVSKSHIYFLTLLETRKHGCKFSAMKSTYTSENSSNYSRPSLTRLCYVVVLNEYLQ